MSDSIWSPIVRIQPPTPSHSANGALAVQPCRAHVVARSSFSKPSPLPEGILVPASRSAQCSVKGCVFPALSQATTVCHYHRLFQSDAEAEHFQSHQPSQSLLMYAPFGVSEGEPDDSRQEDRKRQAAERETFLLDESAGAIWRD